MKANGMVQLTIEVGQCSMPILTYAEYSLTVRLNKQTSASTSFKPRLSSNIDFATKLFLRAERSMLEAAPNVLVVLTAYGEKASRKEMGRGSADAMREGRQTAKIVMSEGCGEAEVSLEFCLTPWEPKQSKSINSRGSNFKSQLSQKQSSSLHKQAECGKSNPLLGQGPNLDKASKEDNADHKFIPIKACRSQKVLGSMCEELETSAATTQQDQRVDENLSKSRDSQVILALQLKIQQLQERISALGQQLSQVKKKEQALVLLIESERASKRVSEREKATLREERDELMALLTLEEERSHLSDRHMERMSRLLEGIALPDEFNFALIEEKDEIVMLNEELENELILKNVAINEMRLEMAALKDKIVLLESPKPQVHHVVQPIPKKTVPGSQKSIEEKIKTQKKIPQKAINAPKKQEQLINAQPNRGRESLKTNKQKQLDTKSKPQVNIDKKPAIPKNPRELKSPPATKAPLLQHPTANSKPQKPKPTTKPLKIQQKTTIQTQKRSQIQSSLASLTMQLDMLSEPHNLMINSRAQQGEYSKLRPN